MNRRSFLATAAAGAVGAVAGCTGPLSFGSKAGPDPQSDRPSVDEIFAAGPMRPQCERGEKGFPPMTQRNRTMQELPADRSVSTVEEYVAGVLRVENVVLLKERPERLGWRGQRFDISERYNTERYFVGWVGRKGSNTTVLLLLYEDYARLYVYKTAANC